MLAQRAPRVKRLASPGRPDGPPGGRAAGPAAGASPFPASSRRTAPLVLRAPKTRCSRMRGRSGGALARRPRGPRSLGGVTPAFAPVASRLRSRERPASLFSTHSGTGLRRCRVPSQRSARRVARPAPPAFGRPLRPDGAPDTPARAAPGRAAARSRSPPLPAPDRPRSDAPGIAAAVATPDAGVRLPRAPPWLSPAGGRLRAGIHGAMLRRSRALIRTERRSRSGRGRAGSIHAAAAMRDDARRRRGPVCGLARRGGVSHPATAAAAVCRGFAAQMELFDFDSTVCDNRTYAASERGNPQKSHAVELTALPSGEAASLRPMRACGASVPPRPARPRDRADERREIAARAPRRAARDSRPRHRSPSREEQGAAATHLLKPL